MLLYCTLASKTFKNVGVKKKKDYMNHKYFWCTCTKNENNILALIIVHLWRVGLGRIKAEFPHMGPEPTWGECPLWGVFLTPVFKLVSEKTTENSKRLGRQARLGIESGTFALVKVVSDWSPENSGLPREIHILFVIS